MTHVRLAVFVVFATVGVTAPSHAQTFAVVDLGVLPGTNASYAEAINDAGVVVGLFGQGGAIACSPGAQRRACATWAR